MHSLLEDYLSEVAAHLGALPIKQRNEELREMRAHLENAVIVSRELGQSEEEAAQNAVAQFGTPQDLGENVVWAWRREEKLNKRSFWGATGCTFAILVFTPVLIVFLPFGPWLPTGFGINSPLIVGMICGSIFWKRGIVGIALGTALYYYVFGVSIMVYVLSLPGMMRLSIPFPHAAWLFFVQETEAVLLTLQVAWIASRLRLTWEKRRRLARA